MMSLSTTFWQLIITQGIMTGLGGGIIFTPSLGVIGQYFDRKRALAMGIATTGNALGGTIYPIMIQQLLPRLGFAWTARILGFMNLTFFVVALALIRPRLAPRASGPILDLHAFKERPYALLVTGMVLVVWPIYYIFYYVSHPLIAKGRDICLHSLYHSCLRTD